MLDIFLKDPKCFGLDISLTGRRKKKQICNKGSLFRTIGLVSVKHTVGGIVFDREICDSSGPEHSCKVGNLKKKICF